MYTPSSPLRCITCRQSLPKDMEQIRYFCQCSLSPEDDDADGLLQECRGLNRYTEALFRLLVDATPSSLDDALLHDCHELALGLAEEANRRVALAQDALELREKRRAQQAGASDVAAAGKAG